MLYFIVCFTIVLWFAVLAGIGLAAESLSKEEAQSYLIYTAATLFTWMYYVFLSGLDWPGG